MGQQAIENISDSKQIRLFEKALLNDVQALEQMIENGMIESDVRRIGAEQELFLVDEAFQPSPQSVDILSEIQDDRFTTELGSFNLEFNLEPMKCEGDCLSVLEQELEKLIGEVRRRANKHNADVVLTGILPTLRKSDLGLGNLTPKPRYKALNEAMTRMRGGHYDLFLRGVDELYVKHDSVMLEACNTSFQVHFQVSSDEFARYYNIAQAIAGPALAVAVNSPLLFGRRLWNETRIALFQQSIDTRSSPRHLRQTPARVHFGNRWIEESVLEIFREDIARFRVLLAMPVEEDPFEALHNGRMPSLKALQVHNSTVYRWTRPCYGITDGKAHFRIENRLFPSGPTVIDEVANAAFWLGLVSGMAKTYKDITRELDFDDVKGNFYAAARRGLRAQMTWIKGEILPVQRLIGEQLLPLARDGLSQAGVNESDVERYLAVIEGRLSKGQTGSEWILRSFTEMKKSSSMEQCLHAICKTMYKQQKQG
ncbi:glutamate-cysteine ligase family protein, partial [bacterium]|nr:glutamate-cysteine ligase family protein [bacterium]